MIIFKKRLNRFYDTKTKKIVSKKYAKNYAVHQITPHLNKESKRRIVNRNNASGKHNHPSYKKLYLQAKHELNNRPTIVETQFHPFIAHRTKDGIDTPKKCINEVRSWMKNHTSNLFVAAALSKNGHFVVSTCGEVNPNEVAGFIQRDLGPALIGKYEDGYNE